MCGLIGVFGEVDRERAIAGLAGIRTRGRDGEGVWVGDGIALGHTRLAIRDVPGGGQPFVGEDGSVVAVVNGELYRTGGIRARLQARGHRFRSHSDSEVVVHLYEEEGTDGLLRLEGEFALLLWDGRRRRLIGARDPFGVRPLVWARSEGRVCLASTARGLHALGVPLDVDPDAVLRSFHHQYLPCGHTPWAGVRALLPGWILTVDAAGLVERAWRLPPLARAERVDDPEGELRRALTAAVADRLDADVPVGCQLSGGVDSAAVLALAGRGRDAFTVSFPGDRDEVDDAREAARALGARLHVVEAAPETLLEALPEAVMESGGLCINGHGAAKLLLARAARSAGVKALLTGEGADGLFFGYLHLRQDLLGPSADLEAENGTTAGIHLAEGLSLPVDGVARRLGFVPSFLAAKASLGHRASSLLNPDLRALGSGRDLLVELVDACDVPGNLAPVDVSSLLWTRLCLSGSILGVLNDPVELLGGVEGRLPFLDSRVVALAMRLPHSWKVRPGQGKSVLRAAMQGVLPDTVRWRPKRPFMAPPLAAEAGFRDRLLDTLPRDLLDRAAVERALALWPSLAPREQVSWDAALTMALSLGILAAPRVDAPLRQGGAA